MIFIGSFRLLGIQVYGTGEECFAPWIRKELWLDYPVLATTVTQLRRELNCGGYMEIQG
jgi:hypothetical protein